MADNMSSVEFTRNSQCSGLLPPSTPIQLRGFLTGDKIQVRGDTDEFNFSLHLNFQNRSFQFPQPSPRSRNHQISHDSTSSSSDLARPQVDNMDKGRTPASSERRSQVVTRLRSGALSSVEYFLPRHRRLRDHSFSSSSPRNRKRLRKRVNKVGEDDLLERILRRRSLPLRPCNSYALFVMAKWGGLGKGKTTCSFADRSRELGKMWSSLEEDQKKCLRKCL